MASNKEIDWMEIDLENLLFSRDAARAICEAGGYHNPDEEMYTGYINDLNREITEAIVQNMRSLCRGSK